MSGTPGPRPLSPAERLDWLRLCRSENVGPVAFRQLLARFGSAAAALDALPALSARGGRARPVRVATAAEAGRELEACERLGVRLLALGEPDYPAPLAAVEDAPPFLALRGRPALLGRPCVAVVGARNASTNGRRLAERLAADLAASGYVVVSGLARGIDTAAHAGALGGGTVAVLAGGVDVVYPPENRPLYDRIAAEGAVVAECPLGTQPQARHFPRRNRLISGLSLAVVVVEAALRSGSLITARLAAEQGRQVFAVPGSPLDPRAQGCNRLIRDGATLVQSAEDVIEDLGGMLPPAVAEAERRPFLPVPEAPESRENGWEAARAALLEHLSPTPTAVDDLLRACQVSAGMAQTVLLELELAGRVERQPGNRVCLL